MKIRNGFVSNSSSSSFIIFTDNELKTRDDVKSIICGNHDIDSIIKYRIFKKCISCLNRLSEENKITENERQIFNKVLEDCDCHLSSDMFYYDNTLHYEHVYSYEVINSVFESLKKGENKEILWDGNYPILEKRVLYKFNKWEDKLKENEYLFNIIYRNVRYDLDNWIYNYKFNSLWLGDKLIENEVNKIAHVLTKQIINYITEYLIKDCHAYIIKYCTDDGKSSKIDYIMESETPLKQYTKFLIVENNH